MSEFWSPPPLFSGAAVFVIGGGPGLRGFDFNRLRGRRCIAINAAGYDVPWADVLLFHDKDWPRQNLRLIQEWAGLVVTVSRPGRSALPEKIEQVQVEPRERFLPGPAIKRGRSSGHSAIALAAAMGAKRIVLLGFDCRRIEGRANYHDRYDCQADDARLDIFRTHFRGWRAPAEADGIEILNATPGTAIDEFRKVPIEELL